MCEEQVKFILGVTIVCFAYITTEKSTSHYFKHNEQNVFSFYWIAIDQHLGYLREKKPKKSSTPGFMIILITSTKDKCKLNV